MSTPTSPEPQSSVIGPILAPGGGSAALASHPDQQLDGARYHMYEAHPAPWWIAAIWVGFFVFAVSYLILNLMH